MDFEKAGSEASDFRISGQHNFNYVCASFGQLVGAFSFGPDTCHKVASFKAVKQAVDGS